MSVEMWNCHSWPLDVGKNLSGYFISNLVLVTSCDTTRGVHLPLVSICALVSMYSYKLTISKWGLIDDIDQWRVHSFYWQFHAGGSICLLYICIVLEIAILDHQLSVTMWNCHSWPLHVSSNINCHCWPLDVSSNEKLAFMTTRCL